MEDVFYDEWESGYAEWKCPNCGRRASNFVTITIATVVVAGLFFGLCFLFEAVKWLFSR
jgi:hypothetical protein